MPKIGARSDLKKTNSYIRRNLGAEVKEQLAAKELAKAERLEALKQTKAQKTEELHRQTRIRRNNNLERTPEKDILDFSTEENGYFIRKDSNGNVLEVIQTMFPR